MPTDEKLKAQLLERLAQTKPVARQIVANEMSDQEHFNRVMNDPTAWTSIGRSTESILPR